MEDPRWNRSLSSLASNAVTAAQAQFRLGVVVARSLGPKRGSVAQIYMTAHGGATSNLEQVNEFVETAAKSNRKSSPLPLPTSGTCSSG